MRRAGLGRAVWGAVGAVGVSPIVGEDRSAGAAGGEARQAEGLGVADGAAVFRASWLPEHDSASVGCGDGAVEDPAEANDDRLDRCRQRGHGFGESMGERRQDAADAAAGLVEVSPPKRRRGEQVEDVAVDGRAGGFHDVEGEGVAVTLVGVPDPECRIEARGVQGECGFGFEQRVEVVEERVCGVDRVPFRAGDG